MTVYEDVSPLDGSYTCSPVLRPNAAQPWRHHNSDAARVINNLLEVIAEQWADRLTLARRRAERAPT